MIAWIIASILFPVGGGLLVLVAPAHWVKRVSVLAALLGAASSLAALVEFARTGRVALTQSVLSVAGLPVLGIVVDDVSALVGLAMVFVGFLVVVYSTGYLTGGNREHPEPEVRRRYYFFLLVFIGAMAGLVYSSTMLGLLVFFEITGVCSWGLIGYYDRPQALRAALKALIVTHLASLGLYLAAAYLFVSSGSFDLAALAGVDETAKLVIFSGLLVACWGKSAQLPLQFWLPEAMEAPTPISAYLHAGAMVKVGVYIFARALLAAGDVPRQIGIVGAVMAVVTLVYGFVMYFPQKDLKRLLAYSTITQLAYIFLALSLSIFGSRLAFRGGIAHLFNHAFAKSLFFLVAGALSYTTGTHLLPALKGVMTRVPLAGVSFAVAALAVTGVPTFNCFFSKFSIFAGGFEAARAVPVLLVLVVVAVLESVGSFVWFLRWYGRTMTGQPSKAVQAAVELPAAMQIVLVVLIAMTLVSGYLAAAWLV